MQSYSELELVGKGSYGKVFKVRSMLSGRRSNGAVQKFCSGGAVPGGSNHHGGAITEQRGRRSSSSIL